MPAISFLPFLQSVPLGTRLLTSILVTLTLAAQLLSFLSAQNSPVPTIRGVDMPWLVLVPGASWLYPWTLLTAGWVELNIFELIFSAISLFFAARYLERVWGPKELIRFCVITVVGSNVIAFGFSWILFILLRQEDALFGLPYHGLSGLQSGFLVAFTQLIPEHQLQVLGVIKVRVKTVPGIYLLISNIVVIVFGPSPYILIQFGFIIAWWYLRFFKLSDNGEFRGDRSETFAFQYWFPPPVRPYISKLSNFVFKMCVRVRIVQAWDEPQTGAYAMLPGPGQARAEAERRRALALKALDARLASSTPAPSTTSPSTSTAPQPPAAPTSPTTSTATSSNPAPPPPLRTTTSSKSVPQVEEVKSDKAKE